MHFGWNQNWLLISNLYKNPTNHTSEVLLEQTQPVKISEVDLGFRFLQHITTQNVSLNRLCSSLSKVDLGFWFLRGLQRMNFYFVLLISETHYQLLLLLSCWVQQCNNYNFYMWTDEDPDWAPVWTLMTEELVSAHHPNRCPHLPRPKTFDVKGVIHTEVMANTWIRLRD